MVSWKECVERGLLIAMERGGGGGGGGGGTDRGRCRQERWLQTAASRCKQPTCNRGKIVRIVETCDIN